MGKKVIQIPKGWKFKKIEGRNISLVKENKPIINWNTEKDGVEVIDGEYHFIIANMPAFKCDWYNANTLINKLGGYMPSLNELKCFYKNRKNIIQCFEKNTGKKVIDPNSGYWSSNVSDDNRYAHVLNSYNQFCKPYPKQSRYGTIDLMHSYRYNEKSYQDFHAIIFKK